MASGKGLEDAETAALIARTGLGDRAAFKLLYQRTSGKLFSVCLRMLKDRADAEEALQDVYVKAWRNASAYRDDVSSPMTWLISIARYTAIDILRRRKPDSEELGEADEIADPLPDPEKSAINAGEGRRIDDCMKTLESDRAEAVRGAYVEGLSYTELAERYGVPLNTMRTWLRRSLMKLRECMDQ